MSTNSVKSAEAAFLSQVIELPELKAHPLPGAPVIGAAMNVINAVKVRLRAVAGEATMTVGELAALREDAVLKLDRPVDEPVDVILDGQVVARGRLVAVGDQFGIQITELARAGKA
jgi:flagellar motor switch protein FliN/FliY